MPLGRFFINIYHSSKLTFILMVITALFTCGVTPTPWPISTLAPVTVWLSLPAASPDGAILSQPTPSAKTADPPSLYPASPRASSTPPAKVKALELVGYLAGLGHEKSSGSGAFDIAGDTLYLAAHETDLRIISVADPTQPHEVSRYQVGTPIVKVVISDRYAFLAETESTLQILDISDPLKLREVGRYHFPVTSIEDLVISGNTLYLAAGESGLRILDISTPTAPVEVDSYEAASVHKLALADHTLHLLGSEWHILDITHPFAPQQMAVNPIFADNFTVTGQYAYFHQQSGLNSGVVRIVDISKPTVPIELEPEYEYHWRLETEPYGVMGTAGHYLFDISSSYFAKSKNIGGTIRMLDVSTPARPVVVGQYETEVVTASFKVMGDETLYVSGRDGELWIFRIRPVTLPQPTAHVTCPHYLGAGVGAVFVRDHYAYVGSGPKLSILDVSNPSRLVEVGRTVMLDPGSDINDIEVTGSLAYLVNGSGLRIVDVSDVTAPVPLSFIPLPGQGEAISVAGDYAYVTRGDWNGLNGSGCVNLGTLHILDISNPLAPQRVKSFNTAAGNCSSTYRAYEVIANDSYVYVADSDSYGLRILDVSNPTQPVEQGHSGGWAKDIIIKDNYAYVSNGYWRGFRIIDISDPTSLKQVAVYETPNSTGPVAMVDQIIYLAEEAKEPYERPEAQDGLRLLDVSNPISPTAVGFYPTSGPVEDITVANGYAYLASGGQLHILDISEPTAPGEVGSFGQSYTFNHFTQVNEHLYLADNHQNELQVIDAVQPLTPTIVATATLNSKSLVKIISQPPYVYAIEQEGLRIFTLAVPTELAELSFYPVEVAPLAEAVIAGNYAYLVNPGDTPLLSILDLSTPTQPSEVGHYNLPPGSSEGKLVQAEKYLYFYYQDNNEAMGVLALSLASPVIPTEISRLKVMDGSLAARGDYAYITNATEGLQRLEVLASTKSVRVQRFPELTGHSLVFKDNYAYLVTRTEGLRLLDLSNPAHPIEVGVVGLGLKGIDWGYSLQGPAIGADYAYLMNDNSLRLIDISEPTAPHEAGYSLFPNFLQTVTLVEDYDYIIDAGYGDLFICQVEKF